MLDIPNPTHAHTHVLSNTHSLMAVAANFQFKCDSSHLQKEDIFHFHRDGIFCGETENIPFKSLSLNV